MTGRTDAVSVKQLPQLVSVVQAAGQKLADTVKNGASVVVELDFKESMAHPDDR